MHADKELIATIVGEIVARLNISRQSQRILIIGARGEAAQLAAKLTEEGDSQLFYSSEQTDLSDCHRYVLPRLELNDMVDLALGRATSHTAETVRELLLAGRQVEVADFAWFAHQESASEPLLGLYRQYQRTLESFGMVVMAQKTQAERLAKKVISEQDLRQCRTRGLQYLEIPAGAIVTALGIDYAREHNIILKRDG